MTDAATRVVLLVLFHGTLCHVAGKLIRQSRRILSTFLLLGRLEVIDSLLLGPKELNTVVEKEARVLVHAISPISRGCVSLLLSLRVEITEVVTRKHVLGNLRRSTRRLMMLDIRHGRSEVIVHLTGRLQADVELRVRRHRCSELRPRRLSIVIVTLALHIVLIVHLLLCFAHQALVETIHDAFLVLFVDPLGLDKLALEVAEVFREHIAESLVCL